MAAKILITHMSDTMAVRSEEQLVVAGGEMLRAETASHFVYELQNFGEGTAPVDDISLLCVMFNPREECEYGVFSSIATGH